MDSKNTILLRTRIAFLGLLLFALTIVGKLVYIQVFQGKEWQKLAKIATVEFRPIKPTRGNIYAQDGSLLATSLPFYKIALDPCVVEEKLFQESIDELSRLLADFYQDKSFQYYKSLLLEARKNKKRYVLLNNRRVNYPDKKKISKWPIFKEGRFKGGIIFEKTEKRFRPFQELASRTLGFVNENKQGVGLENSFNTFLRGVDGGGIYQKLTGGNWKMIQSSTTKRPVHGYDLITTIDINLQDVAHTSLLKVLEQSQASYGTVVVMEVATGEIKAMANLGRLASGNYEEIYNYAIGNHGTTEPGSIFKLVPMMALLEECNLNLTDTVDTGDGSYKFHNLIMHDTKADGYGVLTLQEVFEKSSNIGLAKLVDSVFSNNPNKFIDYIYKLGLHKPLGVQIIGEGVPYIKNPKLSSWTKVTIPWMSMGYELKVTPLQMLTLYNAIANQGKMIQPIIVKQIKQANRIIQTFESKVINKKICSDATLQKLRIMLEGVVERGTARRFRHGYYKIAGKSGTSNKLEKGKYSDATYASFVGYFPADKPRYSCIVVIDNPKGAKYHFGGQVAVPVVKEIADKLSAKDLLTATYIIPCDSMPTELISVKGRVALQKDWQAIVKELELPTSIPIDKEKEWLQISQQDKEISWEVTDMFAIIQVPKVIGMSVKDALFLLENRGIQVKLQGPTNGYVRAQSILPGTKVTSEQTITLDLHA